jgi:hypothetical protein
MAHFYLETKDPEDLIAVTFILHHSTRPEEKQIGLIILKDIDEILDEARVIGVYQEDTGPYVRGAGFKAYARSAFPRFQQFAPIGR